MPSHPLPLLRPLVPHHHSSPAGRPCLIARPWPALLREHPKTVSIIFCPDHFYGPFSTREHPEPSGMACGWPPRSPCTSEVSASAAASAPPACSPAAETGRYFPAAQCTKGFFFHSFLVHAPAAARRSRLVSSRVYLVLSVPPRPLPELCSDFVVICKVCEFIVIHVMI